MLKFKRKPGVRYYPNSTFRVRPGAQKSVNCTLRAMSDRAKKRVANYTADTFAKWGRRCFLCGRGPKQTKLVIHHMDGRANGDNVDRMVPLCDGRCGCHAHNHNGMGDPRTRELNAEIEQKMKQMGVL